MPFPDPDLDLCVDGSPYYLNSDQVTGYSVTPENKVVEPSPLTPKLSEQAAEWIALTKTCQLSKDKTVNTLILDMPLECATPLGSSGRGVGL